MKPNMILFLLKQIVFSLLQRNTHCMLTRNLSVVVHQVLFPLLRCHIIVHAEDQILLVIFFLAVAESIYFN